MNLTNRLGLPRSIVNAVRNDPYPSHKTLSVTTLVSPPQLAKLRREHAGEVTEDVADRLWALYGQLGHSVVERAAQEGDIAERRIFASVAGARVSGQFDLLERNGTLSDFKFTSVYAMKDREVKAEWVAQLNILCVLLTIGENVEPDWPQVTRLQIVAMARDWRQSEAMRDDGYPEKAAILDVPMWPKDEALAYLHERVMLHQSENPPPCTDEERWHQPDAWALMKKGRKRAVKLFEQKPENVTLTDGQYWEHRPGAYRRCESYCNAAPFCAQWAADRKEPETAEEVA